MTAVPAEPFPQSRTLTVLSLVQVIGGIGNGAGLAVGALLVKEISGSSGWAGTATVMLTLGAAAATLPLSRLAVANGRRPALATGWLLGSVGAAVTVVAAELASLPLVLLGLLLFGASTAANLQSRFAATDRSQPERIGRSLSIVVWSTTVGAVAGPNLTGPGAALARSLELPELSGPMLFSATAFAVSGLMTFIALRPDPLAIASTDRAESGSLMAHLRGPTLTAILTISASHAVMVGVMSLTPIHMADHGDSLEVIGLTISLHIAGMFALSPIFGWLSDRWGPTRIVIAGQLTLVLAVAIAGTAGDSDVLIAVGLTLLGIGWSASVIAAAALLTLSVDPAARTAVQGISDLSMNISGAIGGLSAGLMMALSGYGALNAAAGLLTVPILLLVLSGRRAAAELRSVR